ncbi:hypothetical protein BC827DRAFT_1159342 [Russula dissimulans]|nr:hypothetical protein BC827DRAFT_1159342 [Russula dissimulans]
MKAVVSRESWVQFAQCALTPTGCLFWEVPGKQPCGALWPPYIIKVFSAHIKMIQGSVIRDPEQQPWGAISLALTATQHVFECWTTGTLNDLTPLSKETAEDLTCGHHYGSVMRLKAAKFDKIISDAHELISPPKVHLEEDVVIVFDPSSPVKGSDERHALSSPVRGLDDSEWYM